MGSTLVFDEQVVIGGFEGNETGPARADNARNPIRVLKGNPQACHIHGFVRGSRCEPGVAVGVQNDLVAREMLEACLGVKVLDLRGNQDLEVLNVKTLDLPYPDLGTAAPGPELGHSRTDRRHGPHARDDHAAWSA